MGISIKFVKYRKLKANNNRYYFTSRRNIKIQRKVPGSKNMVKLSTREWSNFKLKKVEEPVRETSFGYFSLLKREQNRSTYKSEESRSIYILIF